MTVEDLVAVQANAGVRVRTSKTASLPGLMSAFQVCTPLQNRPAGHRTAPCPGVTASSFC